MHPERDTALETEGAIISCGSNRLRTEGPHKIHLEIEGVPKKVVRRFTHTYELDTKCIC